MIDNQDKTYNRIVLIGNGFDKALGLETSYADFIFNYIKEKLIEAFQNRGCDNELIKIQITGALSPDIVRMHAAKINNFSSNNELLVYNSSMVNIEYKCDFLREIVNNYSEARWVDIEQYYYKSLIGQFKNFSKTNNKQVPKKVIELNNCMDALSVELSKYINEQQNGNSIDYSTSQFSALFEDFPEPLRPKRSELIRDHKRKDSPAKVLFLNFNYTDTVLRFLKYTNWTKSAPRHIHIHGSVKTETNPIIFGYGDDTGDIYKELELEGENEWLRIIKSFKYPRTQYYHDLLNFLRDKPFNVFVVGHSCGLSDKTLLKTIFEHVNCLAIQNYHYKGEEEDFNKRMQISRHFSNKILMRERVLPFDEYATIPQSP